MMTTTKQNTKRGNRTILPEKKETSNTITDAGRAARNQYQRAYYQKNKERVKGWQEAYWQRKAEGGVARRAEED